ncbi:MAG: amino acid adenylation domain-containing protein [Bacteroidota bacterium]
MSSSQSNKSALLAQWRSRKEGLAKPTIGRKPAGIEVSPTSGQLRLWLLQQLYPGNPFYQYGHLYRINGPLDVKLLEKSWSVLLERHEILGVDFKVAEQEENSQELETTRIIQRDHRDFSWQLARFDLRDTPPTQREEQALAKAQTFAKLPYNLEEAPLWRIGLLQLDSAEFWLVFSIHHIIGDRASLLVLNEELFTIYGDLAAGKDPSLPEPSLQFQDYAHWKNQQSTPEDHRAYWLQQLAGELPVLEPPSDFQRPRRPSFRGQTITQRLSTEVSQAVKKLAREYATTNYVVLLAAFKAFLFRYTGEGDLLVGSPFSNRDRRELEKLIGFFNETLVLRTNVNGEESFHRLVQSVKATTEAALARKHVPFDDLVRELGADRRNGVNPIFQAMFVYNTATESSRQVADLRIADEPIDLGVAKFDLTLFATDRGQHIELGLEYTSDLYKQVSAQAMLHHFKVYVEEIAKAPKEKIGFLPMLDEEDYQRILKDWNDTDTPLPTANSIHELILQRTDEELDHPAVSDINQTISYAELFSQSVAIANGLVANGVEPGQFVGLYVERSVDMIVGILGILRAGGAYLPLDPAYPQQRINFLIEDADIKVLLAQEKLVPSLEERDNLTILGLTTLLTEGPHPANFAVSSPNDWAYMIYTSGSTGQPKGVAVTHNNLLASTAARFSFFAHQPAAFLLLSSFSFDSSVAGIFWTLTSGGTLVVPPLRIEQDMAELTRWISRHKISHTLLLPSLYRILLEQASVTELSTLKTVMVAGEACAPAVISTHFQRLPGVELVNEYGPTESTVWSTAHHFKPEDAFGTVPIGGPIPYAKNYVLDANQQPVPPMVVGELYIGGPGVTKGYHKRPALTAERFFSSPFVDGQTLYRTGDRVRYRHDGKIDFLGRMDRQVKIRGHRIEPEEIKKVIDRLPEVADSLVRVAGNDNLVQLIAYIIPFPEVHLPDVRAILQRQLPEYMVPAAFVPLKEWPKLPNGKIDLHQLPVPDGEAFGVEADFEEPATATEKQLVDIWEQVLKVQPIGRRTNFFSIGGDSIRSIQVIGAARKAGLEIAPQLLFEYQTIAELGAALDNVHDSVDNKTNGEATVARSSLVALKKSGHREPLFCIHSGGAHVFFYRPLAERLSSDRPLYALQPAGLDGKEEHHPSIAAMATAYLAEVRRVQPTGPYHLLGTCFSNEVGLEMANQLYAAGEKIAVLIFVDSAPAYLLGANERGGKQTTRRFLAMLQQGDWKGIRRKLRNRWIRTRQKAMAPLENEEQRNLRTTINNLNQLYHHYTWHPFPGKVTFIRSTEFAERADKKYQLEQWDKLAGGGLDVHITQGHHLTLFAEPEVDGLAKLVNDCLEKSHTG